MIMKVSLKHTIQSADPSTFFGGALYTEPELLPFEFAHIFRRTWLYLGDRTHLFQSGNVLATDVSHQSILLLQDHIDQIRAFYNVCPHRASLLCPDAGSHQLKHLVCPYHGWVYNLQGQLMGMPREEQFPDSFCLQDFPLTEVRVEQWQGFIFICFDQDAPTLSEFLGDIPTTLAGHRTTTTKLMLQKQYTVNCNWKVYHDNTLCDYHVAIAHRKTLNPVQGPVRLYEHHFNPYVNLLYTPTTPDWRSRNSVLESLPERNRQGFFTFGIFPNLHLLALPNGILAWIRLDPLTVETCVVYLEIYGIPGLSPDSEGLLQEFEAFMFEDIKITEGVQRGYASGIYHHGPINHLEDRIAHHQQLIREFLMTGLRHATF
jgi:phenylpropionate dioxygenase-like ring-hydroxylating dioxygenase large terminal subunit